MTTLTNNTFDDDLLREVINIGVGDAANALSLLVKSPVKIKVPDIMLMGRDQIVNYMKSDLIDIGVFISQSFGGAIEGRALLAYSMKCSKSMLLALTGKSSEIDTLSKIEVSILEEVGNLIIVSCLATIGNLIENQITISMPMVSTNGGEIFFQNLAKRMVVYNQCIIVKTKLEVKDLKLEGHIFIFLSFTDINTIITTLKNKANK